MPKKEPKNYELAPEVRDLARHLADRHFANLSSATIVGVFGTEPQKERGKAVVAKTTITRGRAAWLAHNLLTEADASDPAPFFVIEVHKNAWGMMEPHQKNAVIHNEVCKMQVDGDSGNLKLKDYDCKEFKDVVKLYGFWREGIEDLVKAAQSHQTALPGTESTARPKAPAKPKNHLKLAEGAQA